MARRAVFLILIPRWPRQNRLREPAEAEGRQGVKAPVAHSLAANGAAAVGQLASNTPPMGRKQSVNLVPS